MTLPSRPNEDAEPAQETPEPVQPSAANRSPYWRPPGSPTGSGRFVTAALAGTVGVLAILIATSVSIVANRELWTDGTGNELTPFAMGWLAGVGFAVVGMGILTGIAWLVWQHRAHANLLTLTGDALKPTVIWWWLVPVASLFMPFLAIRDLARGDRDRPGLRKSWWAAYLLFGVASALTTIVPLSIEEGTWQEALAVVSYLFGIVAALLAIRVVAMINAGLEARRLEQGWPVGWKPLAGRAQLLLAVGGATAASVGALFMGLIFPELLREIATDETATTATRDFSVGVCFNDSEDGYPVIGCTEPHEAEVYAVLTHPDQEVYPGVEGIESWAEPVCYGRFERYTGIRYEESSLDFGYLYPGAQGWAAGDHQVICYLFDPAGDPLTEPVSTDSGSA